MHIQLWCVMQKKMYVLASYQKIVWDLYLHALTGVFKFELTVCLGYHSCPTQRLGSHKHTESVVYLLPCNIIIILSS